MTYVLIALPIIALAASVFFGIKAFKNGKKSRGIVVKQLLAFMAIAVVTFAVPMVASAAEGGSAAQTEHITITEDGTVARSSDGLGLIAAGMVTGISGIGGGIAVAAAAPAAMRKMLPLKRGMPSSPLSRPSSQRKKRNSKKENSNNTALPLYTDTTQPSQPLPLFQVFLSPR